MPNAIDMQEIARLNANFLEEYTSGDSIRKYTRQTAGYGISYLLDHDYGKIYLTVIEKYVPKSIRSRGIRLWEFGCGGGMNLVHLVSMLERMGIRVDVAIGTDFSPALIDAARSDARKYLKPELASKVKFAVAANENLLKESVKGLGLKEIDLTGTFDLLLGVNTIRYCHRLKNVGRCVEGIRDLLKDGGVCVNIDMNNRFPAFRSKLRHTGKKLDENEILLPTLDEYAQPFAEAGLELIAKKNFCWVPHSAGRGLTMVMRTLSPVLNVVARSRGMRSLVISKKKTAGRSARS